MSIWSSWEAIGYDAAWDEQGPGEVRAYASGFSNHFPTAEVEPPASIDLASIPAYCVPGHRDDLAADERGLIGTWVRLSISSPNALTWWRKDKNGNPVVEPAAASVVMDEAAARALRDQLSEWIDRDKARPTATPLEAQ